MYIYIYTPGAHQAHQPPPGAGGRAVTPGGVLRIVLCLTKSIDSKTLISYEFVKQFNLT